MTGSFLPLIDLLISLLTAIYHVYKLLIHNLNHKTIENNLDFYLEDITESTRNTNRIKELRGIKNNQIFCHEMMCQCVTEKSMFLNI